MNLIREFTAFGRYVIIFALAAPTALAVWLIFHAVFTNLTKSEEAMGYVDPLTQMGISLGYIAMVGGTLTFAGIAIWAAVRAVRLWSGGKKGNG